MKTNPKTLLNWYKDHASEPWAKNCNTPPCSFTDSKQVHTFKKGLSIYYLRLLLMKSYLLPNYAFSDLF